MNKYLNPEALAEALAAGQTADEIALAMSNALNEAVRAQKAEQEKKQKEAMIAEAENDVVAALRTWMELVFPGYKMSDADAQSAREGLALLREDVVPMLALLEASQPTKAVYPSTPVKKPAADVLSQFLAENGLM